MKKIIIAIIVIIIGSGLTYGGSRYYLKSKINYAGSELSKKRSLVPLHETFYEQTYFARALAEAQGAEAREIKAIIAPHHLPAAKIIASLISSARRDNIKTVVIIGPNHEDRNSNTIASAYLSWQTPLGEASTDNKLVKAFLAGLRLYDQPESFMSEHSIGAIVPFVKYYLPRAEVLPIIFNSTAKLGEADEVARWLDANLDEQSLVIFSLDFSHYLSEEEARRKDEVTKDLILSRNVAEIIKLNSDYLDSPATLATALLLADYRGWKTEIAFEANSNDFSEQSATETTSYFGIKFIK